MTNNSSIFANNKALAIDLLRKAGSGDNLLAVLNMISEDVKANTQA